VLSTVTVIPIASTIGQSASSLQGVSTSAPAIGSSQPLSSAIGASGSAGSEECAQASTIILSASPSIITVTQSPSIITVIQTAGVSSPSSGAGYPGSPMNSTSSSSLPGKAVSSAQGASVSLSSVITPGVVLPTGSPYSAGSSNGTSGYYASGTGSNKPTQRTSSIPGITAAAGSATATPSQSLHRLC